MLAPGSSSLAWVMACSRLVAKTMSEPLLVTTLNGSGGGGSGVRALSAMGGVVLPRHHAAGQRLAINGRYKLKQSSPGRASLQWAGIARAMAPSPQPPQQRAPGPWMGVVQQIIGVGSVVLLGWTAERLWDQTRINQLVTSKMEELCDRTARLEQAQKEQEAKNAQRDAEHAEVRAEVRALRDYLGAGYSIKR